MLKPAVYFIFFLLAIPFANAQDVGNSWYFISGDSNEALSSFTIPSFEKGEKVRLPHKVYSPDHALWYQGMHCSMDNVCVSVIADDGAQVWLDKERIYADKNGHYCLPGSSDTATLMIRVLNNAVAGGLKQVKIADRADMKANNYPLLSKINSKRVAGIFNNVTSTDKDRCVVQLWGDSQGGWNAFHEICQLMAREQADLNIGLGDFVSNGRNDAEWQEFSSIIQPVAETRPLFLVPGNHDYDGFYDHLVPENFLQFSKKEKQQTFDWIRIKDVAFIALDPNRNFPLGIDAGQQIWADSIYNLTEWKEARWKVLLIHQVPYGAGWKGYDGESFLRDYIHKVIKSAHFDVVAGGHIHDYERVSRKVLGKEVLFLVSGGAGGSLEPEENDHRWLMDVIRKQHHYCRLEFTPDFLTLFVLNSKNEIIDQLKYIKI